MRLDSTGQQIGRAEYHTPQSQQIMDTGSEQLVSVNIQEAMQVRVLRCVGAGRSAGGQVRGAAGTAATLLSPASAQLA